MWDSDSRPLVSSTVAMFAMPPTMRPRTDSRSNVRDGANRFLPPAEQTTDPLHAIHEASEANTLGSCKMCHTSFDSRHLFAGVEAAVYEVRQRSPDAVVGDHDAHVRVGAEQEKTQHSGLHLSRIQHWAPTRTQGCQAAQRPRKTRARTPTYLHEKL